MSDDRASRALARVKAGQRRARTAVEVRCTRKAHVLASFHPLGNREFLAWRRAGRLTGSRRDTDEWTRYGVATPGLDQQGFGPGEETAHVVYAPDADTPEALFGYPGPVLSCWCGPVAVELSLVDEIGTALYNWWDGSQGRPLTVFVG